MPSNAYVPAAVSKRDVIPDALDRAIECPDRREKAIGA